MRTTRRTFGLSFALLKQDTSGRLRSRRPRHPRSPLRRALRVAWLRNSGLGDSAIQWKNLRPPDLQTTALAIAGLAMVDFYENRLTWRSKGFVAPSALIPTSGLCFKPWTGCGAQ